MSDAVETAQCVMCRVWSADVIDGLCGEDGSTPYIDTRGRLVQRCAGHPDQGPWVCGASMTRHRNVQHGGAIPVAERPRPWQLAWWRGSNPGAGR